MPCAADVVAALSLSPHPEGGWYRETWRDVARGGGRGCGTAILYLLEAGQRSHWHRIDAEEIWLFHTGAPLALSVTGESGARSWRLGTDVLGGETPQARVPAGVWQSAEPLEACSLVSCVVAPAFEFAGFELAPPGWTPA